MATYNLHESMQIWGWEKQTREIYRQKVSTPKPGPGEVLVANVAAGINPVDWKLVTTPLGEIWSNGQVPGVDGAGQVVAVGDDADEAWLGARVCYHQGILNPGSFAEYTVVSRKALMRLPDALSYLDAASFPCPVMTAWQAIEKIPVIPEAPVLISGASGAVGRALIQLAVERGFTVSAMARPGRHDELRKLGALHCLGETGEAAGRGYYAIFDTVSGVHASSLVQHAQLNGHVICIQDRISQHPLPPFSKAVSIHEVALNAMHTYASATQWQHFTTAGEALMQEIVDGLFVLPPVEVKPFAAADESLDEVQHKRKHLKYVLNLQF